jgi:hypothetical protein
MDDVRLDGCIHGKLEMRQTLDNKTKPARRSFIEEGLGRVRGAVNLARVNSADTGAISITKIGDKTASFAWTSFYAGECGPRERQSRGRQSEQPVHTQDAFVRAISAAELPAVFRLDLGVLRYTQIQVHLDLPER